MFVVYFTSAPCCVRYPPLPPTGAREQASFAIGRANSLPNVISFPKIDHREVLRSPSSIPSPTLSRATGAVGGTWERSCPPPPAPLERRLTALSRFAPISKKEFWRGPEQILILDTWGRCVKKKRFNKLEKKKSRSS